MSRSFSYPSGSRRCGEQYYRCLVASDGQQPSSRSSPIGPVLHVSASNLKSALSASASLPPISATTDRVLRVPLRCFDIVLPALVYIRLGNFQNTTRHAQQHQHGLQLQSVCKEKRRKRDPARRPPDLRWGSCRTRYSTWQDNVTISALACNLAGSCVTSGRSLRITQSIKSIKKIGSQQIVERRNI